MRKRNPLGLRLLGGGQEFQEDRAHELPDDLWVGPPPGTQTQAGSSFDDLPGIPDGLAGSAASAKQQDPYSRLPPDVQALIYAAQRRGDIFMFSGTVGVTPILVRAAELRTYFIIQNGSSANSLLVGIGNAPSILTGGFTGFLLAANGGNYEPSVVPQGDIWVLGSAAGTLFTIGIANR